MKRHDLDLLSLIAGAVFALVALTSLVGAATDESVDFGWLAPVVLIGLGIAGLTGALRSGRTRDGQEAPEDS